MYSDKKEFYYFLITLERISTKINIEITNLKKKLKISEYKPEIRNCSYNLYNKILIPLFNEKASISLQEIIEKSDKKKPTILCYLSELYKNGYILKIKNQYGDKRTKLYKKS